MGTSWWLETDPVFGGSPPKKDDTHPGDPQERYKRKRDSCCLARCLMRETSCACCMLVAFDRETFERDLSKQKANRLQSAVRVSGRAE